MKYTDPSCSDYRKFEQIKDAMKTQTEKLEQIRVDMENKRTLSKVNEKLKQREVNINNLKWINKIFKLIFHINNYRNL